MWSNFEYNRRCIRDLEKIRSSLHNYFLYVVPGLTTDLLSYADELDTAYKGGVIGGAGGITAGGASIADFVKAKDARTKAQKQLSACSETFNDVLRQCNEISEELKHYGDIERTFPTWCTFWANLILGSGAVASGFGWKMVANTILNAIRLGKGIDAAADVTSATIPVFRTLGTAMKGVHIAGGVASAVFLPIDLYFLVSNSVELHKNEAHGDSQRIRDIVTEVQNKCLTAEEIDRMIDSCIAVLRH